MLVFKLVRLSTHLGLNTSDSHSNTFALPVLDEAKEHQSAQECLLSKISNMGSLGTIRFSLLGSEPFTIDVRVSPNKYRCIPLRLKYGSRNC